MLTRYFYYTDNSTPLRFNIGLEELDIRKLAALQDYYRGMSRSDVIRALIRKELAESHPDITDSNLPKVADIKATKTRRRAG